MKRAALLALALSAAACAAGPTVGERAASLLGRTQLEVVRDLGVPDATVQAEGVRVLRWSWEATFHDYPPPPWIWDGGLAYPATVVHRACHLEIEFRRDDGDGTGPWRARDWRTRGNACR